MYFIFICSCKVCNDSKNKSLASIDEVREITGDFIAVNCVNMTCRCAKSKYGLSPFCHTSNGCADLILVRKTSRINYIRYLLRLSRNNYFVSFYNYFDSKLKFKRNIYVE